MAGHSSKFIPAAAHRLGYKLSCWPATRCTGYPPSRPAGKQLLSGRPLPGIVPGGRPALQGNPVAGQSSGNFYPGWRPHGKRARDSRLSRVRQPCGQLGGMWHGGRGAASSAPTHAGHHRCTSCEPSASWEAAAADDMTAAHGAGAIKGPRGDMASHTICVFGGRADAAHV